MILRQESSRDWLPQRRKGINESEAKRIARMKVTVRSSARRKAGMTASEVALMFGGNAMAVLGSRGDQGSGGNWSTAGQEAANDAAAKDAAAMDVMYERSAGSRSKYKEVAKRSA